MFSFPSKVAPSNPPEEGPASLIVDPALPRNGLPRDFRALGVRKSVTLSAGCGRGWGEASGEVCAALRLHKLQKFVRLCVVRAVNLDQYFIISLVTAPTAPL